MDSKPQPQFIGEFDYALPWWRGIMNLKGRTMRIMQRRAVDDFDALLTAQGKMEDAGARVISIVVYDNRWYVWARVESDTQMDVVDAAIDKERMTATKGR